MRRGDFKLNVNSEDLEAVADALLKKNNSDKGEYPAYCEKYLAARDRRRGEVSLEEAFDKSGIEFKQVTDLMDVLWAEIVSGAHRKGLSDRQIECLKLKAGGCTITEIAFAMSWSESTVKRDLARSARLLCSIPAFGLWSVLAEVFECSVGRIRAILMQ